MNLVKAKGYIYGFVIIICLTAIIIDLYYSITPTIKGVVKGDDYIYYDPKQVTLFLLLPAMIVADLSVVFLLLPFRKKTDIIRQKFMIPTMVYAIAAFIIGILLSIVISIYPLGTDYYQCRSTSMVSSGSYYARSEEMCKQRAYLTTTEEKQLPQTPEYNEMEPPAR